MLKYIVKRLLWIIPVLIGVTIIVFTILYFSPGDPAYLALGDNATPRLWKPTAWKWVSTVPTGSVLAGR